MQAAQGLSKCYSVMSLFPSTADGIQVDHDGRPNLANLGARRRVEADKPDLTLFGVATVAM